MRQPRLLSVPVVGLYPIDLAEANDLLVRWEHKLGECRRPFRSECFALELDDKPIAVAISASIVHGPVAGFSTQEVVELARCAASVPWANRVMIRLWREVLAPRWKCWPVRAAVSYSHNGMHNGNLYRFDGWEKVKDDCGGSGGGTWSRKRSPDEPVMGKKTLWLWRY